MNAALMERPRHIFSDFIYFLNIFSKFPHVFQMFSHFSILSFLHCSFCFLDFLYIFLTFFKFLQSYARPAADIIQNQLAAGSFLFVGILNVNKNIGNNFITYFPHGAPTPYFSPSLLIVLHLTCFSYFCHISGAALAVAPRPASFRFCVH